MSRIVPNRGGSEGFSSFHPTTWWRTIGSSGHFCARLETQWGKCHLWQYQTIVKLYQAFISRRFRRQMGEALRRPVLRQWKHCSGSRCRQPSTCLSWLAHCSCGQALRFLSPGSRCTDSKRFGCFMLFQKANFDESFVFFEDLLQAGSVILVVFASLVAMRSWPPVCYFRFPTVEGCTVCMAVCNQCMMPIQSLQH